MVELAPIPKVELKRIAEANKDLLDVAEELLALSKHGDGGFQSALRLAVTRLMSSSAAISSAVQSTAYVSSAS